ncbi:MAG: hypothetical protein AAGC85_00750 [Bacteroidota bacterium]
MKYRKDLYPLTYEKGAIWVLGGVFVFPFISHPGVFVAYGLKGQLGSLVES